MFKPIQSGFWPCLLLCVPFVAHAFDTAPAEVELTPSATFAEFSGGATSAPNPVALCLTNTIDCDTLSLTVTLPEGFTALHPGTTVEISLDSGSDYDFVVREAESGDTVTSAVTAGNPETAAFVAQDGSTTYVVETNLWVGVPLAGYAGTVELNVREPGDTGGGDTGGGDTGGSGGDAYSQVPSVPGQPRVVVAVIDSAINPYHDGYYSNGSTVTKEILAELGVSPENVVSLTRTGDFAADLAADAEFWGSVESQTAYHFLGTNIIAISHAGSGINPLLPESSKSSHGVGTSSSVIAGNPEAVIYFVESEGALGSEEAHRAAFLKPAVDIVTTSYGVSVPGTGLQLPEDRAFEHTYESVVGQGKLHFSSAGNNVGFSNLRAGAGPWWSIGVSGIEEDPDAEPGSESDQLLSGILPDFVSDYTQALPYCMNCESEVDSSVPGTSFSTPLAAGVTSAVLLEARKRLGHGGGIDTSGDGLPLMVNASGVGVSNWFLRRAMEQAAYIPSGGDFGIVGSISDPLSTSTPINPLAPWLQIAWGELSAVPAKAVVASALAHLGFDGEDRIKDTGFCEFQTELLLQRQIYWNDIAPNLPGLLGGELTGQTPEEDPFIFCESLVPTHPESNDPGGSGQIDTGGDNAAPLAVLTGPTTAEVGETVTFSATDSSDADGDALTYRFDFGDGTVTDATATAVADHAYSMAADFTVTVSVTDTSGAMDAATHVITVVDGETGGNDPGPGSTIEATLSVGGESERVEAQAPVTLTFDASATAYADAQGNAFEYTFVFGDEATEDEFAAPTTSAVVEHEYDAAGTYTAYVVVTDAFGNQDKSNEVVVETTILITVGGGNGTVAQLTVDETDGPAPLTVNFDGSRSFAAEGQSIDEYCFDFGVDGGSPQCGDQPTATYVYTVPGSYEPSLTVTASDASTATAKASVAVGSDPANPGTPADPASQSGGGSGALGGLFLLPLLGFGLAGRRRV